jgi:hypothetical protein
VFDRVYIVGSHFVYTQVYSSKFILIVVVTIRSDI